MQGRGIEVHALLKRLTLQCTAASVSVYLICGKKTVFKVKRQSGQQYFTARGKVMPERSHEKRSSCNSCRFKCHEKISDSNRRLLHENFWKMTDDAKFAYYEQTTGRFLKERTRIEHTSSRRTYSYQYFFVINNDKVRVCKTFYLSTLDISQRRISYYHETMRIRAPHSFYWHGQAGSAWQTR